MSIYPPPSRYPSLFNPANFDDSSSSSSSSTGDIAYAKLAGNETFIGTESFQTGIKTDVIASYTATGTSIQITDPLQVINNSSLTAISMYPSATDSTITLKGTDSQFGSLQFTNNNDVTKGNITVSQTALNLDFKSLSDGLKVNSSGNTKFQVTPTGAVTIASSLSINNGYITRANPYWTWTGVSPVNWLVDSNTLPELAESYLTGDFTVYANRTGLSTLGGYLVTTLVKSNGTLTVVGGTAVKNSTSGFATFSVTKTTNSSITININPVSAFRWVFTGFTGSAGFP